MAAGRVIARHEVVEVVGLRLVSGALAGVEGKGHALEGVRGPPGGGAPTALGVVLGDLDSSSKHQYSLGAT